MKSTQFALRKYNKQKLFFFLETSSTSKNVPEKNVPIPLMSHDNLPYCLRDGRLSQGVTKK